MPRIPDRWLDYSSTGTQISDTPFIALKCPLNESFFNDDIPQEKRFTVSDVKTLIPSLSMIIDLTFTNKYYDPQLFQKMDVVHEKIYTLGHEIPSQNVLKRFFRIVDNFLQNKQDGKGGLIGVHCTHGVNRTGFIICSYMISKLGYTFENAVKEFNQARGHNIERQNYLGRLKLYETDPLSFIHNENDDDPSHDFNNARRTKERVKPRWRHMRFNNVHPYNEPRESTSTLNHSYRRTDHNFPYRYQQQFDSAPRRMQHPYSMPSYHNQWGHDYRRRDYSRHDFRRSNVLPPQNVFRNRCKFDGPRSPRFSHHPPPDIQLNITDLNVS